MKYLEKMLLCVIAVSTICLTISARNVQAQTCGGATPCKCGDMLTSSRTMDDADDVEDCSSSWGLLISSPDITLDCAKKTISGTGNNGILVSGASGAMVKNCVISGFTVGIQLTSGTGGHIVQNNTIDGSGVGTGININSIPDNLIGGTPSEGNIITGRNQGIAILGVGASANIVSGNIATDNTIDVVVTGGLDTKNVVYNNKLWTALDATQASSTYWERPGGIGAGPNILGQDVLAGNYWTNASGTGFSDTCSDLSPADGVCDSPFAIYGGAAEYDLLPLSQGTSSSETEPVPVGENVVVEFPVSGVTLTFASVTKAGEASLSVMSDAPASPSGFEAIGEVYDITTDAVYDAAGGVTVSVSWCAHCIPEGVSWCAHCTPEDLESFLTMMHFEQSVSWCAHCSSWEDVTAIVDTSSDIITGYANGLSPFAVMLLTDQVAAIGDVVSTVSLMNLARGIDNSLDAKLESALSALTDKVSGNDASAINKLEAFINACQAQSGQFLTAEQANKLITMAEALIATLTLSQE